MFERITERLSKVVSGLGRNWQLTDRNLKDVLREIQTALIEADVAVEIARQFTDDLHTKVAGIKTDHRSSPAQALVNLVHQELVALMGQPSPLNLKTKPPAVILLAGLQGAGKTTSAAKLARHLSELKHKVALVSCDVHRPAAVSQLAVLAEQINCTCYPTAMDSAGTTAQQALEKAKEEYYDVLIVDTAGRIHIDQEIMDELCAVHHAVSPVEVLFVMDSMSGQDALVSARAFSDTLPLTGIILTKIDGDTRGGSALSARAATGKPIKFIGMGEKTDALQVFHPDRIASRILGMGEMQTLLEQYDRVTDRTQSKNLANKVSKGQFDLNDLKNQLCQIQEMGGLSSLIDKLPGGVAQAAKSKPAAAEMQFAKMTAVIDSMTEHEKKRPGCINGSRKKRIATGSGTHIQDVNRVLKQHAQMQKMFRKGGKLKRMMAGLSKGAPPQF